MPPFKQRGLQIAVVINKIKYNCTIFSTCTKMPDSMYFNENIFQRTKKKICLRLSQLGPVNLPTGQLHVYGLVQVPPCSQGGSQMAKK